MNDILDLHRWVAEGLLIVMVLNLLIPYAKRRDSKRMVFWTRVGYFAFWAFWTMVVFGGLITWIFKLREWSPSVVVMMMVALALVPMDIYRAVKLKRLWIAGDDGIRFNTLWVGIEITVTAATIAYALMVK